MIVRMDGKYTTRHGDPVRILCVDSDLNDPVIGIHDGGVWTWGLDGKFNESGERSALDLIEVSPPPPSPLAAAARKVVETLRTGSVSEFHSALRALESALKDEEIAK
jgi:hypothetical protein